MPSKLFYLPAILYLINFHSTARTIVYRNIHNGVSMTVHRIAEVDDDLKEQYQEVSDDLLHISKQQIGRAHV